MEVEESEPATTTTTTVSTANVGGPETSAGGDHGALPPGTSISAMVPGTGPSSGDVSGAPASEVVAAAAAGAAAGATAATGPNSVGVTAGLTNSASVPPQQQQLQQQQPHTLRADTSAAGTLSSSSEAAMDVEEDAGPSGSAGRLNAASASSSLLSLSTSPASMKQSGHNQQQQQQLQQQQQQQQSGSPAPSTSAEGASGAACGMAAPPGPAGGTGATAAGQQPVAGTSGESDSNSTSVMASGSVQPSVTIQLHPLVIMNVAEHWTRIRAQNGGTPEQVVGALLGKQEGRALEVSNSFELEVKRDHEGHLLINPEFLEKQQRQFRQVFKDLELLGWYTTGGEPTVADVRVHRQLCNFNDASVMLKLDPLLARGAGQLPVTMFESVIDMVNKEATMLFVPLPCSLVTEEAERIGLDNMARVSVADSGDGSLASQHLRSQHSTIKMLYQRVKMIEEYVKAVEQGSLPRNWAILREVISLCRQLPVVESAQFREDYFTQCNDVALQAFLGTLTKCCDTINVYVNRFNTLYEKQSGARRGKRMHF